MSKACLNCSQQIQDDFCGSCGQKNIEKGIKVKDVWNDFTNSFFGIDSPFWNTFKGLFTNPGRVSREFIEGKRKKYSKPVQYFLIAIAFYFLLRSIFNYDPVEYANGQFGNQGSNEKILPRMMKVNHWISRNVNFILPLWVVILSLFDYLFFYKDKFSFAERACHFFYSIAQYVFYSSLLIPFYTFFNLPYYSSYLIVMVYMSYSIVRFHQRKLLWSSVKAVFMAFLSFAVYVITAVAIVFIMFSLFSK